MLRDGRSIFFLDQYIQEQVFYTKLLRQISR